MGMYDLLWKYQENDLELDKLENALKKSDLRRNLMKERKVLLDAQEQMARMDQDAERRQAQFQKLLEEVEALEKALTQFVEDNHEEDEELAWEEIAEMRQEGEDLQKQFKEKEKELARIMSDMANLEKQINDLRVRVPKAKKTYIELKAQYDAELAKVEEAQAPYKKIKEEMEGQIDKKLLARYKQLRQSLPTGLAKLVDGKCGGCNMSLSAVAQQGVGGAGIVECENCGRMLYVPQE